VVQALSAQRRMPLAAQSAGVRFLTISAPTSSGLPLIIAVRVLGGLDQQIIGAREMTAPELARLEAWEATSCPIQCSEGQVADAAAAFGRGEVAYDETARVELPPVPESEPMVALGIRVPPDLANRVREAAAQEGMAYSQLVRRWIEVGLTERMAGDQVAALSVLRQAIAPAAQCGQAA
jgi:hypothetical protein